MSERVNENLAPQEQAPVQSKGFKCPNCGGPVNLELPGKSQTIRCPYCSSILEPQHDVLVLREKYNEKLKYRMWVPLGAMGTLEGVQYKCVGMVVRGDDDDGEWSEYLLFNPYHGYRYLVESSGHWTLVRSEPGLGFDSSGRPGMTGPTGKILLAGKKLKYFTHYDATVKSIVGEFPWQASLGEENEVTEYINPPYQASCEVVYAYVAPDGKQYSKKELEDLGSRKGETGERLNEIANNRRLIESNWSIGEYKYPEEIQAAFDLKEMPAKVGFGMCEPNPAKRRYLFSLVWSALLFLATSVTCSVVSGRAEEKNILTRTLSLNSAEFEYKTEGATDYLEFNFEPGNIELTKETNVEFKFSSALSQQWVSFNVFMINESTGAGYIYDGELSRYYGGSGEDAWSEGANDTDFTTEKMPPGNYYLFVAGATNVGVAEFKNSLLRFGQRVDAPVVPVTAPIAPGPAGKKPFAAKATQAAPAAAANPAQPVSPGGGTAVKTGKQLPMDFPGKNFAPKLSLVMAAKRDVASVGSGVLFIFMLIGFNIYYYIRYRMKEGER